MLTAYQVNGSGIASPLCTNVVLYYIELCIIYSCSDTLQRGNGKWIKGIEE